MGGGACGVVSNATTTQLPRSSQLSTVELPGPGARLGQSGGVPHSSRPVPPGVLVPATPGWRTPACRLATASSCQPAARLSSRFLSCRLRPSPLLVFTTLHLAHTDTLSKASTAASPIGPSYHYYSTTTDHLASPNTVTMKAVLLSLAAAGLVAAQDFSGQPDCAVRQLTQSTSHPSY